MLRLIFVFVCTWYTLILKYNFIASNLFTIELINVLYGNNMCSWCPESKKGQLWCDVENMVHRDILVFFTTSSYAATFKCIRITLNCTCRFMEPFVASHPHSSPFLCNEEKKLHFLCVCELCWWTSWTDLRLALEPQSMQQRTTSVQF